MRRQKAMLDGSLYKGLLPRGTEVFAGSGVSEY